MPYAQIHYPFENQDLFEKRFPADFIAEGIDQVCTLPRTLISLIDDQPHRQSQTRGWFYTLLVLSTCLTGKPAFKNLIVNGLILAEYVHLSPPFHADSTTTTHRRIFASFSGMARR